MILYVKKKERLVFRMLDVKRPNVLNWLAILLVLLKGHPVAHFLYFIDDTWGLSDVQFYVLDDIISILIIVLAIILFVKLSDKEALRFHFKWEYVGYIIAVIIWHFLWTFLASMFIHRTGNAEGIAYSYQEMSETWYFVRFMILALIIGPVGEELLFRGLIMTVFKKYQKYKIDMIVSASLFAFVHMSLYDLRIGDFIFYFVPGMFYAWYFKKTNSIYWTILAHVAWNALIFWLETRV